MDMPDTAGADHPVIPGRTALLLAPLWGVVLWLAFPPVAFGPAAVIGVALFTLTVWGVRPRRALGLGLVTGAVLFVLLLDWMRVVGVDAWLLLSALCASWMALAGLGTALASRLPGAPVWVASVWVLVEALRARVPFGGFPWGNLAFSQPDTGFGNAAALGGTPFVTFLVALVGAALVAVAIAGRQGRRRAVGAWLAVAVAATALPMLVIVPTAGDEIGGAATARIAIVQGGTPQVGLGAMDVRRAVLDNHVAQTLDLAQAISDGAAEQPDFVLWPENSTDIDPFTDPTVAQAITAAARAVAAPILVGAVITAEGEPRGSGTWASCGTPSWDPRRCTSRPTRSPSASTSRSGT